MSGPASSWWTRNPTTSSGRRSWAKPGISSCKRGLLLLQAQLLHQPFLLGDRAQRVGVIVGAAEIERLLVELGHRFAIGRLFHPALERVVQDLDDARVHAGRPGD